MNIGGGFMLKCALCLFFITIVTLNEVGSVAVKPHLHAHQHHREREEDGALSPKDHDHNKNGEHRSEFDHEAILGSTKEAEEFDHLSPAEAKRRLRILLTKMDLNNDFQIDRNELHAWILRSFKMLSEEESNERFEDADANEDGKVTWDEYVAEVYGMDDDEDPEDVKRDEDEQKLMADDKAIFDAADINKDGSLNRQEFFGLTHPEETPSTLPIILTQTMKEKDINKDGFVDFQEFVGDKGTDKSKEWLMVEKDKFDHEFDRDKDGRLDSSEVLSWLVPSNDEVARDEVVHLFAAADDDHDDLLSFNEVLEHHDVFVGSEATDYGDHLHNIHVFQDEL